MKTYEQRIRLVDQHMAIARAIAAMPETPRRRIEWGMTAHRPSSGRRADPG